MISVIIPSYNRSAFLKEAINSVLSQSFKYFELIIVDDGSTDDTKEIIHKYNDSRIIYLYQSNKGPSSARNLGIRQSKYNKIAFLDSDDTWDKEKLSIQFEAMKNTDALISHTEELWFKSGNLIFQKKIHKKHNGNIFEASLKLCCVGMSTVMASKELFDKIGLFDETLPCCEDYDFWLRVSIENKFLLIKKPLTFKNGGRSDQVSAIYSRGMDKFRISSINKILKLGLLDGRRRRIAIKELIKKCDIYGNGCNKYGKIDEYKHYINLKENYLKILENISLKTQKEV